MPRAGIMGTESTPSLAHELLAMPDSQEAAGTAGEKGLFGSRQSAFPVDISKRDSMKIRDIRPSPTSAEKDGNRS